MAAKGDNVKLKHRHHGAAKGTVGKVVSVHTGVYYGIALGGATAFVPAAHVDDHDGDDNDTPAAPATGGLSSQAWESAMESLSKR